MLHLQKHLHLSVPHRCLLSVIRFAATASAAASPDRALFAAEDYLVATCGLTPAQALRASRFISHLKSPSNPDAVLAFLSGVGLTPSDVAAAVARDPRLLCCKVDKTLTPRIAALQDHGLSPSQIARLVLVDRAGFRHTTVVSKLQYYVPLFGSFENLLQALKTNSYLLISDLERVVKPNVALLMECGLDACDIAKLSVPMPRLLTTNPELVLAMVVRAEAVGVPRGSVMFRHSLQAVAFRSEDKIAAKVEVLKKTFRWLDAEVAIAVAKLPVVLQFSKDRLRCMSDFLISQVGLEPEYIAHRPALLTYSLERRLRPRHYVVKFLKENGLLENDRSFYTAVQLSENIFIEKFIRPYKEAAPSLAQDYAAVCKGELPTGFRFQEPGTSLDSV